MLKILAGSASQSFGQKVAESFGGELVPVKTTRFSDGEFTVSIEETIRGKEVAIVQSTFPPTDNLMELLLLVELCRWLASVSVSANPTFALHPSHLMRTLRALPPRWHSVPL